MRIRHALIFAAAIGCGGGGAEGPKGPTGPTGTGSAAKPTGPGDYSLDIDAQEIKGLVFEPEVLSLIRPGMPLVDAKKKTTIEKQRTVFANTKDPVQKQAQAAILATLLYKESKSKTGPEADKLITEARQVLRDAATGAGENVDEITLRLLGSYELMLADYPAAEAAWGKLVLVAPKDKDEPYHRAWWVFSLLKNYKNQEALAAIKDVKLDDKQPELAYVTAWAKWRTGDDAGAWQAILVAAKGMKDVSGQAREALDRDLLLFAGRTGASMADAISSLSPVFGTSKDAQYGMIAKLGLQSYGFAGRWNDGVAAIEKALDVIGDKVPANDRPVLRYQQADFTVRLDDPVTAEKYAKQALEALPQCGQKCSAKEMATVVESVNVMATLFHILYATANDVRYYQPAHDLYSATIPLLTSNQAKRDESQKNFDILERTLKGMKAGTGKHDKGATQALLSRHNQEVQACYEEGLAANPKLTGGFKLVLEVDQKGTVTGASTEPPPGLADLAAVAGCTIERAKTWKLPARGEPGTSRISVPYRLSVRTP